MPLEWRLKIANLGNQRVQYPVDEEHPITPRTLRAIITQEMLRGTPVEPRCPHARECGGCAFQDRSYEDQVTAKARALYRVWHRFPEAHWIEPISVVPSPSPYAYRTRMDYVATRGRFGLRRSGRWNDIIALQTCHLIPPEAFDAARALWLRAQQLGIPDYHLRTHEGFLRYVVVRCSPQRTFLLIAVTAGHTDYATSMEELASLALTYPGVVGFHWLCNATRTDLSFGTTVRHWGEPLLPMLVGDKTLCIGPNTFFQNNVTLLPLLLDAIRDGVRGMGANIGTGRVVDLYSGVGTIALYLSDLPLSTVTLVESHQESAVLARRNTALNAPRTDVGGTTRTGCRMEVVCSEVLSFLREQPVGAYDCCILDPPRTGAGHAVCQEFLRLAPRRIIYLSCNVLTQMQDIQWLMSRYRLVSLCGYDMFPHTPHIESLAVLDAVG